jgi:predicted phage gp36 major capsid-like protein
LTRKQERVRKQPSRKVEEIELKKKTVVIEEATDCNAEKEITDDASKFKKKSEEAEAALKQLKNEIDHYIKRAAEAEAALADFRASLHSYIDMDQDELKGIYIQKGIKIVGGKPTKKHKFVFAILKQMM